MSAANPRQYLLDTRLPCQVAKIVHDNVSAVVDHGIPQPTCSFCLRDFPCLRKDFGFDMLRLFGPVGRRDRAHNPLSVLFLAATKATLSPLFTSKLQFAFAVPRMLVGLTIWCHRKSGWRIGPVIARERHAHHSCTSFVSRSVAFTTSYLLATVGAALSGSAKGDPRCTLCVSLTGTLVRRPRTFVSWLASLGALGLEG
jgi:hypothetical protein